MKRIMLFYCLFFTICCNAQIDLPGLRASKENLSMLNVYKGSNVIKSIEINPNYVEGKSTIRYTGYRWLHKQDGFVCQKFVYNPKKFMAYTKIHFVIVDINGEFKETLYEASEDEYITNYGVSPSDSKMVFSLCIRDTSIVSIDQWPVSIHIIDRQTKSTIRILNNFCPSDNFDLTEGCWSPDENKFIYTITERKTFKVNGEKVSKLKRPKGIYVYDITKNEHTKISDFGQDPVWSPKDNNTIAYVTDRDRIIFHDAITNQDSLYYQAKECEKITSMKWSPDGEYILIFGYSWKKNPKKTKNYEYLIRVSTKEIVKHNKIGFANSYFSWRKEDLSPDSLK